MSEAVQIVPPLPLALSIDQGAGSVIIMGVSTQQASRLPPEPQEAKRQSLCGPLDVYQRKGLNRGWPVQNRYALTAMAEQNAQRRRKLVALVDSRLEWRARECCSAAPDQIAMRLPAKMPIRRFCNSEARGVKHAPAFKGAVGKTLRRRQRFWRNAGTARLRP